MTRKLISDVNHSTASKEYSDWYSAYKYLKANGYTDLNSVRMMCEDVGITVELHHEWVCRLILDASEARYPNM